MKGVQERVAARPLSQLVGVPPKPYPSTNVEHDELASIQGYLPGASTLEILDRFSAGIRGGRSGRMLSITGPYGSGKSTMVVFLCALATGSDSPQWKKASKILRQFSPSTYRTVYYSRRKAGTDKRGMIRCVVTARREPIIATVVRALQRGVESYLRQNKRRSFEKSNALRKAVRTVQRAGSLPTDDVIAIIESLCEMAPVMIVIDEFGKNIEHYAYEESSQGDLYLLQQLAEMSGSDRKIPLSIITLQHMAFEEYAIGASTAQRQEWAKIQGRFEDIPFANSPDQTRQLVSETISVTKNTALARSVKKWADKEAMAMNDLGFDSISDPSLIASCYPLGPLALEVLPELCSRYGQYERTLLSFITDASRHSVATFIDEGTWKAGDLPVIGLDRLYDYFIAGTAMARAGSTNVTRLMEVETIIRDSHGLGAEETKVLKTIGVLNLIGRSGYLRASSKLIDHAVGGGSRQALEKLASKSIITYREHADEYRIWHGTDIDIAARLHAGRMRYQKATIDNVLAETVRLDAVIAARHGTMNGTMRIFERRIWAKPGIHTDTSYDGAIIYTTSETAVPECSVPVVMAHSPETPSLRAAAIEVAVIREIIDGGVGSDWVARKELEERLASAEIALDREFGSAQWSFTWDGKRIKNKSPGAVASHVCDKVYHMTPEIYNEMINRNVLSTQGASARRTILDHMITNTGKKEFGIEGYGPDMAIYKAIFSTHHMHTGSKKTGWRIARPRKGTIMHMWDAMKYMVERSAGRVALTDVYGVCTAPPFGAKMGTIPIITIAMLLAHKDAIAVYEHGSYIPRITPEMAERVLKNPDNYEVKYVKNTKPRKMVIEEVLSRLGLDPGSGVLGAVSHMARTASSLTPYMKKTSNLDKGALAVRDAILSAREPDTLLFKSLPEALGFVAADNMADGDAARFSDMLTKAISVLQKGFSATLYDMQKILLDHTGVDSRADLSLAASVLLNNVTDQQMKGFLTAAAADVLEKDEDWMKYIAMSLTNVPPDNWKDEERKMFENKLAEVSETFKRLSSMNFVKARGLFSMPSYQVTITHADGREIYDIMTLEPARRMRMKAKAKRIIKDMKKNGFTKKEIGSFISMLHYELSR